MSVQVPWCHRDLFFFSFSSKFTAIPFSSKLCVSCDQATKSEKKKRKCAAAMIWFSKVLSSPTAEVLNESEQRNGTLRAVSGKHKMEAWSCCEHVETRAFTRPTHSTLAPWEHVTAKSSPLFVPALTDAISFLLALLSARLRPAHGRASAAGLLPVPRRLSLSSSLNS